MQDSGVYARFFRYFVHSGLHLCNTDLLIRSQSFLDRAHAVFGFVFGDPVFVPAQDIERISDLIFDRGSGHTGIPPAGNAARVG